MFTDIAGYTSLTQKNEMLSLELLEEHRSILRQVFVQYNGIEIETIGDAFFVEFEGALNAIRCAIEIQKKLYDRNINQPSERKIKIRIGLHIGDVMHMGKHLHGDGVNIAARVHTLAVPGGIVISEDFWRQIKNITGFSFLTMGRFKLKGFEQAIKIYALKNEGIATPSLNKRLLSGTSLIKKIRITIALIIILIFYISPLHQTFLNVLDTSTLPEEKRLAILPFNVINGDSASKSFRDGLVETLTSQVTMLEKFHGSLFVLPAADIRTEKIASANQAWQKFKVPLTVTGSIQKLNDLYRRTLNLIDSKSLNQLRSLVLTIQKNRLSILQDSLIIELSRILNLELKPELRKMLIAGGTNISDAYSFYFKKGEDC